ncbi:MAG TPA: thiol peroxidase [Candidatus Latescibacteria bacterium]|nr:thiol peroxidase [Candidatus Latescibacterota bacterium]
MATERPGGATLHGNEFTLIGDELKVGDKAPDFSVLSSDLSAVTLDSYKGRVKVICAVPSLDTPTCDTEIRRFNQEAVGLDDNIAVLTISVDLPFAQGRWCGDAGVENVTALSDHRDTSFGEAYGALIKELRLLTRAVFVVDADNIIRHVEYVMEISGEPDYDTALNAARVAV